MALMLAALLVIRRGYPHAPPYFEWVVPALVAMGLLDFTHALISYGPAFFWSRGLPTLLGGLLMGMVWFPIAKVP